MSRLRWFPLLALLLATLPGLAAGLPSPLTATSDKPLTVHFLDVGQGDAALVISPTGKTVLIDGGPPEARERLNKRLRELVNGPLDLVILTHPHLDHLGGLAQTLRTIGARRFMDPGFDHPSEAYRDLLEVVGDTVGQVMNPEPGPSSPNGLLTIGLGEGVSLTVLWPRAPKEPFLVGTRSDANSNSIVAKLTYGKTAFLLVGDAEPDTEGMLLKKGLDLSTTVLKVAHHGGRHSSTAAFLAAAKPQAAVISCGAKNDYGHPAPETLERLGAVGAHVLRTDRDGEVVAASDGNTVTLRTHGGDGAMVVVSGGQGLAPSVPVLVPPPAPETKRPGAGARQSRDDTGGASSRGGSEGQERYIGLKGSKVFHRETCSTLKRSKSERTVYPNREAALRERRPSEDCHP
ncbi:ComEC/Rec2 family competence protein [Myxococcus sp. MISCRS1]|uniref:ComEC/Rec2 family competence protein n=1 Tax=Myxococcus sp. MISCRS1 TaxID=2996786 RepID=UPI0022720A10|nr:ComEC/Rec2 family competence protein [Myxococcus sp. MISCRS1]MCY1001641.1 ComEC/Rec2 family competence protein [Myxococcus sp. MISCRS1]